MDQTSNVGTAFSVTVQTDEPSTVYYTVLASGTAAPTSAAVKAGVSGAVAGGAISVPTANTDAQASITGLVSETPYDLYFAAEDGSGNMMSHPTNAGTGPGGAGQITAGYCDVTQPSYVGTPATPSAHPSSFASYEDTVCQTASVLTPETPYDVYMVATDDTHHGDAGVNTMPSVTKLTVTTRDVTPPQFTLSTPKIVVGGKGIDVFVSLNEVGKFYFVVLPAADTAPTCAEVRAGTGSGGASATAQFPLTTVLTGFYDGIVAQPNQEVLGSVWSLTSETAYKVYICAEDNVDQSKDSGDSDSSPNLQSSPTVLSFTTHDITPPEYAPSSSSPRVSQICGTNLTLTSGLNEGGTVFYTVQFANATAPTSLDVRQRPLRHSPAPR